MRARRFPFRAYKAESEARYFYIYTQTKRQNRGSEIHPFSREDGKFPLFLRLTSFFGKVRNGISRLKKMLLQALLHSVSVIFVS